MPGDHPNSATKFARHCGHLEAALYALGVPFTSVVPAVWMKKLGALPKDKPARKRAIREEMQRRFPALAVTLKTADALGVVRNPRKGVPVMIACVIHLIEIAPGCVIMAMSPDNSKAPNAN